MLSASLSLRCETTETCEPIVSLKTPPPIAPVRPSTPLHDKPDDAALEERLKPSSHVLWFGPAAGALSYAH